jgi:hypothetical protein
MDPRRFYFGIVAVMALVQTVVIALGYYEPSHKAVAVTAFCAFAMTCASRVTRHE